MGLRTVAVAAHTNSRPSRGLSQLAGLSVDALTAGRRLFAVAVAGLALGFYAPAALAHEHLASEAQVEPSAQIAELVSRGTSTTGWVWPVRP